VLDEQGGDFMVMADRAAASRIVRQALLLRPVCVRKWRLVKCMAELPGIHAAAQFIAA